MSTFKACDLMSIAAVQIEQNMRYTQIVLPMLFPMYKKFMDFDSLVLKHWTVSIISSKTDDPSLWSSSKTSYRVALNSLHHSIQLCQLLNIHCRAKNESSTWQDQQWKFAHQTVAEAARPGKMFSAQRYCQILSRTFLCDWSFLGT